MKKIWVLILLAILAITWVFAYTPSSDLQDKMDSVVEQFENIIDIKWESYRANILSAIDVYLLRYWSDDRAKYILEYLAAELWSSDMRVSSQYMWEYSIDDSVYGTQVDVSISWDSRLMSANALPNHDTGSFPNSWNPNAITTQDKNYDLDLTPQYTWNAVFARESWVAYNGIKFELETAERVECESGQEYKIEAIQDMTDLGLDHQHAHVQPTGEYHYHAAGPWLTDSLEWENIVHLWYANDGFPIYYSKQGTYSASYSLIGTPREWSSCSYRWNTVLIDNTTPDGTYVSDWTYDASWDLDSCNGIELDGKYVYFMTDEYPYGPRCLNGEYQESAGPGNSQSGPPSGWSRPPRR